MSLPRTARLRPPVLATWTVLAVFSLSGCADFGFGDTPLGASAEARGVAQGEEILGSVENPDGDITVTLAPAAAPRPSEGSNSVGEDIVACDYESSEARFSCPTEGLEPGVYRVEVTDAKFESEGTHLVTVAVTADGSYAPRVLGSSSGRQIELAGWSPERPVTVFVNGDDGRTRRAGVVTPDENGQAVLQVKKKLGSGLVSVLPSDGVWDERKVEGWDRVFVDLPA